MTDTRKGWMSSCHSPRCVLGTHDGPHADADGRSWPQLPPGFTEGYRQGVELAPQPGDRLENIEAQLAQLTEAVIVLTEAVRSLNKSYVG